MLLRLVAFWLLVSLLSRGGQVAAAVKGKATAGQGVIEEVNGRQLTKLLQEKDYVAVFWYSKNCKPCDSALNSLETIDDKTDNFGVDFVKINDKRTAKTYNIVEFPALTYFRNKEPVHFTGDLENGDSVLEFLTSLESMDNPDRIEEVNAKILDKIVNENPFVAVLFYTPDCRKCEKALRELENIDDEADELGIAFVKINDDELADEYNLDSLPALVYYRAKIPIVFEGDLTKEEQVLEWLIQNKNTGDEEDEEIESVSFKALGTLIESVDHLVVLFFDGSPLSAAALKELEHIDDDCGRSGIEFVKTEDKKAAKEHGIDSLPQLVYFENRIPNLYDGDLRDEDAVLKWLIYQKSSDEIEQVTDEMLDRLIKESKYLAVLFYSEDQKESREVLVELENIDDECDQKGIVFVKIDDLSEAAEYGIDETPKLVYFENSIPSVYEGDLLKEDDVLLWLIQQTESDEIEEVTDEMLEKLITNNQQLAVLFYDKTQRKSQKIIQELENIDDECDKHGIIFVKISDEAKVRELGISIPALVYFENRVPHLYEGELTDEDNVLAWLLHQLQSDEIEEVTDEMLDQLIDKNPYVAALFYDKDDKADLRILNELENIDDECDTHGILFVKIDDDSEAKEYGFEELPVLVYFENRVPSVYEGDLNVEEEVLKWLVEQRTTDTIEEVTDEMLEKLVSTHQYVAVFFSGPCDEGEGECSSILNQLESLDDDTDEAGIQMVTTEEIEFGKKLHIKEYPALVMFRNGEPLFFTGDLSDEDEVLTWLTDEETLELPDRIEEVNLKMLQRMLDINEHVVVFFYHPTDKKSVRILQDLENIDDDADDENIAFVKISDEAMLREYDLDPLPTLVYFRAKFPQIYPGHDLTKEEAVLEWLLKLKRSPRDVIEEVDRRTLRMLLDELDHVAVLFYEESCTKVCEDILHDLETIDDDADEVGINLVKTTDLTVAEELGIKDYPKLVYYQGGLPSVYKGEDLSDEGAILGWMRRIHAISSGLDEEPSRCVLMSLKDEFESTPKNYRCCPPTLDLCAGMIKITDSAPGGKESGKKKKKKRGGHAHCPCSKEGDGDSASEEDDDDDDDDDSEEEEDEEILSAKELARQRKEKEDQLTQLEKQRREEVRKRILTTGKLSSGDLGEEVLEWLVYQRKFEALPELTRSDLEDLVGDSDYLAVLFFTNYSDTQSARALRRASLIAEDAATFGIPIAKMSDHVIAKKYGVRDLPGLILFRKGRHIKYEEDMEDEEEMLDWLTAPENMILNDQIEVVNQKMLHRMREMTDHLAVLFFSETECKQCERVVSALEEIDDEADGAGIAFVRVDDWALAKSFGVHALPALLYFRLGSDEPVIFAGDLRSPQRILEWLLMRKDPSGVAMTEVGGAELNEIISSEEHSIVVFFYNKTECNACETEKHAASSRRRKHEGTEDPEQEAARMALCAKCHATLEKLENVDDEVARHGVTMLTTADLEFASTQGVNEFPALVYFENGAASVYEGDMDAEEDVLHWIVEHKTEEMIELVTRGMLEQLLIETHYLAVFFYKQPCRACDTILMELEKIDDECDLFGIHMVKIADPQLAKRYGITTFPALLYFRNGNPLLFEGDMKNEESVLEWLSDGDNRELADEIEAVNQRMLERLVDSSPFLAVFFFDEDECGEECDLILAALEEIDDDADSYGIDMVKVPEGNVAAEFGIMTTPTLAYFRRGTALIYEGDLNDPSQILGWLTSNEAFELKDEIEEVNRRMLEKILDDSDFVAVYFYEPPEDCSRCEEILEELERIDQETDNLDIIFVKIHDTKYAKKWGVAKIPALVYFRRKFPSIYRGDLIDELAVLEWLQKNRYKQPELNLFMFSLSSLSLAFVIYTIFILVCLKE